MIVIDSENFTVKCYNSLYQKNRSGLLGKNCLRLKRVVAAMWYARMSCWWQNQIYL